MNEVQIGIIAVVAVVVITIIVYYIYQENKFKKLIENNFNQATTDVINQDQGLVFEAMDESKLNPLSASQKDIHITQIETKLQQKEINFDPLLNDEELSEVKPKVNTFFAAYDNLAFPWSEKISPELDHVIDITFEKAVKIKILPDINSILQKNSQYFILDKSGHWSLYQRGQKYAASGVKLIINLVDNDGVLSPLQLENLYNELAKFALHHEGHIRQSDSELNIRKIQQQLKGLQQAELELGLYIINKDPLDYRHLAKYFESNGFSNKNGVFEFRDDSGVAFSVCDENSKPFNELSNYRTFAINSSLHNQANPQTAIDKIFNFAEHYMQYFESRLLTTNKLIMTEKEYQALEKQVNNYVASCKRQGVELGSALIKRVFA